MTARRWTGIFGGRPSPRTPLRTSKLRHLRSLVLIWAIASVFFTHPKCSPAAANAAESDPYYAWHRPPTDASLSLNHAINQKFTSVLEEIERFGLSARMSCMDVARTLTWPLWGTAMWYFVGGMNDLALSPVPRTNTELREEYMPKSIYQHSRLWKWGFIVPPDPTIRVAGVNFSTDKLGHFFHEGREYFEVWHAALNAGHSGQDAHEIAIWSGIRDENMIQGDIISGIFSYADLEANEQGFRFLQSLCAEHAPGLRRVDGKWALTRAFDIRMWVNPCWDEAFYPSAFSPRVGEGVRKVLPSYCALRKRPHVARQRAFYEAQGCKSFSFYYLEELRLAGWIPDNEAYDLENLCPATATPEKYTGGKDGVSENAAGSKNEHTP